MKLYKVIWEIDLYADTPKHAAALALGVLQRHVESETTPPFQVTGPDGQKHVVDLDED